MLMLHDDLDPLPHLFQRRREVARDLRLCHVDPHNSFDHKSYPAAIATSLARPN
jgi:hypothetical protein